MKKIVSVLALILMISFVSNAQDKSNKKKKTYKVEKTDTSLPIGKPITNRGVYLLEFTEGESEPVVFKWVKM